MVINFYWAQKMTKYLMYSNKWLFENSADARTRVNENMNFSIAKRTCKINKN